MPGAMEALKTFSGDSEWDSNTSSKGVFGCIGMYRVRCADYWHLGFPYNPKHPGEIAPKVWYFRCGAKRSPNTRKRGTPWKMNGWNLQPSPVKRKENDLNQTSMRTCSMFIFQGVGVSISMCEYPACFQPFPTQNPQKKTAKNRREAEIALGLGTRGTISNGCRSCTAPRML